MRHQAKDVSFPTTDAGDVVARAIWIRSLGDISFRVAVPKNYPRLALQLLKCLIVAHVITFSVGDGKAQDGAHLEFVGKRTVVSFDSDVNVLTNEVKITIAYQGARQQSRFAQDLKAIANPQNEPPALRKLLHRSHYRRESCQGTRAQVIAVRKPARYDHRVVTTQIRVAMPNKIDRLAHVFRNNVIGIVVAVRAGKNYDSVFHSSNSVVYSTGLQDYEIRNKE